MFVLKENVFLEQLEQIFEENKNSNVYDKTCLYDNKFLKIVCVFSSIPIGYVAVYPYADFLQKESIQAQIKIEPNAVYLWHIAVKKAFEGKGVASALLEEVIQRYSARPIYSVMEEMNTATIMLHTRAGFKPFAKFKKIYEGQQVNLLLMKRG